MWNASWGWIRLYAILSFRITWIVIETLEVLNRSYDVQNHGFVNVSENDENQNEEEPVSSEKRAMDEEEDEKASNEVFLTFSVDHFRL